MKKQLYGAGIWHFATYVDRYATDGYGEPRSVLEAIEVTQRLAAIKSIEAVIPGDGWPVFKNGHDALTDLAENL